MRQYRDHDRGTESLPAKLGKLFWILRNAEGADWLEPLGPIAIAGCSVATMENPTSSRSTAISWGSARGWRVLPLEVVSMPGISHGPKLSPWGFSMPISNRLSFRHCSTSGGLSSRTAQYGPVRRVVFVWGDWPTNRDENLCTINPGAGGNGRCHTG